MYPEHVEELHLFAGVAGVDDAVGEDEGGTRAHGKRAPLALRSIGDVYPLGKKNTQNENENENNAQKHLFTFLP